MAAILAVGGLSLTVLAMQDSLAQAFISLPLLVSAACLYVGSKPSIAAEYDQSASFSVFIKKNAVYFGIAFTALLMVATVSHKTMAQLSDPDRYKGEVIEVGGISYREGVQYYSGGQIEAGLLAKVDSLMGHELPTGSTIAWHPNGNSKFVFLSKNYEIDGILCRGHGHDYMTSFYPNGQLRTCWPAEDVVVQSVPCRKVITFFDLFTGSAGIRFHRNGQLQKAKLSDSLTVQGVHFAAGDHIEFDENGSLVVPLND
jgi:hypothetical protein